jgi:hypothetical protein
MKSNIILCVLVIACIGFGVACSFSDTPVQVLANKEHRAVIIKSIALSPEYRTQMMDELMSNDSSKVWLLQYLMHHKIIMNDLFDLTAKDSIASRDLMAKTIEMCDGDAEKCRLLMGTLSSYPNIISYTKTSYHFQKPVY